MASHVRNLFFWQSKRSSFKTASVILITGAGSGIGQQIARIYSQRPCRLVLADINDSGLRETERLCKAIAPTLECLLVTVDVTDQASCQSMVAQCLARYRSLDVMVLCAGIGAHHIFHSTNDLAIFNKLMAVNFYGYLYCIHAAYEALCQSNGILVAITSFSGEVGLPYRTAYCASKFAVTGLLESLRSEMAVVDSEHGSSGKDKFHITIVCPPTVNTNLRKNSLTPDPTLRNSGPSTGGMSVTECAEAIVDAADRRLRKAFFPFHSWIASYLRPLVPDVMDTFIMKKASKL